MNKLIISMFVMLLGIFQIHSEVIHKVQRGESIESVSRQYGITVDELISTNVGCDKLFYIGMTLKIPISSKAIGITNVDSVNYSAISNNDIIMSAKEKNMAADAEYYKQNFCFDDAIKIYNKLCKKYPRAEYYFNRGMCHYYNGKFRQSAKDLRQAIEMDDCTREMVSLGNEMLAKAEERHEEWKSKKGKLFGDIATNIIGGVAVATTQTNIIPTSNYDSTGYSISPNTSSYANWGVATPNQMGWGQYTPEQGPVISNQVGWGQYNPQESQIASSIKEGWEQFNAMQGQVIMPLDQGLMQTTVVSDYGNTNNSQGSSQDILNSSVGEKCLSCKGSKKCHACNGTKVASSMGNTYACTVCQNGECPVCHGTGLASWNR